MTTNHARPPSLHLAIDGNEANVSHRVGSNVYAFEIIRHLELLLRDYAQIKTTVLLATPPQPDLPTPRTGFQYQVLSPRPLWTQVALPLHLYTYPHRYHILYTPGHYAPRWCPLPTITSVMDLGFEVYPHFFTDSDVYKLSQWTRSSVNQASQVIAISQFTKQEVHRLYGKRLSQIQVAPPALSILPSLTSAQVDLELSQLKIDQPYLLYVGTLQPRKNLLTVIKAFEVLKDQLAANKKLTRSSYDNIQLVLAGKVGWLADPILQATKSSPHQKDIRQLGFVTDQQKVALYVKAEASVLVGWYEGFGIPPLESIALGCVPVVANTSSLPEVVGQAGRQVDPAQPQQLAEAWLKILTASGKQKALWRSAGKRQLAQFSWSSSAQTVLDTILSVANQS